MGAGFVDKFSVGSEDYRRARPTYPRRLIATLADLSPNRDRAWDSGTGNGQAAVALAEHFASVVATDASAQQIAQARPSERVTYAVETAEQISLPDASVDLVLAAQAMHWYDLDRFFSQARRVLRPAGILAAIGYSWQYIDPEVDAVVDEWLLQPLRKHWAPNNVLLWNGYRDIAFPGTEIQVAAPAIHRYWSLTEFLDYVGSWSAVRSLVADAGEEAICVAYERVREVWGNAEQCRHVVMPMQVRVARVD